MATCKKIPAKPVEPPATYQLTLSAEEADMLLALVGRVSNTGTFRDAANGVYRALRDSFGHTTWHDRDSLVRLPSTAFTKLARQSW